MSTHFENAAIAHGGQLRAAAKQYRIPLSDWMDISTGINPHAWPVPAVPTDCWRRLPEDNDDGLLEAAQCYYGCDPLLAIPGSQAAIQILPILRPRCRILLSANSYAEHARNWRAAGHTVTSVPISQLHEHVAQHDVVVIINPDNPSGESTCVDTLLAWRQNLAQRGGWLIVDEAYIDTQPANSLAAHSPLPGMLVLRSLGKFFGLAGIRLGVLIAEQSILEAVARHLGPWSISHPTRWIATQALRDNAWQMRTRELLQRESERLKTLLAQLNGTILPGSQLFQTVLLQHSKQIHIHLARQGILTRLLDDGSGIRFGLPGSAQAWLRLESALTSI